MQDRRDDKVGRRTMLAGAGTVGALAAAATLMPTRESAAPAKKDAQQLAADSADGYRLSEHVKQYYRTTRV